MYIKQLNDQTVSRIKKDLIHVLTAEGLTDEQELSIVVENGLNSKLNDIAHILDVKEYMKEDTMIGCLEYMQRMDNNGTWDDAITEIWMGEQIETDDVQYTIDTLKAWHDDLVNDTDKDAERMKVEMERWIERLNGIR